MKTLGLLLVCALAPLAHADDEIDVRASEYLDVVETADGSIWKGLLVEQTPNVQYKIATADGSLHVIKAADVKKLSKQRNRDYHRIAAPAPAPAPAVTAPEPAPAPAPAEAGAAVAAPDGVAQRFEPAPSDPGMPAPFAKSGLRIDPELAIVIPAGDIGMFDPSVSPSVQGGYELMLGNIGLEGGGLIRHSYWRLPGQTEDAAWTLETMAYARAALHISRVALYTGAAVGLDTNYIHSAQLNMDKTTMGLGLNVQGGIEIAASRKVGIKAGFDYHPGTDTIVDGAPGSISYFAVLVGVGLHI